MMEDGCYTLQGLTVRDVPVEQEAYRGGHKRGMWEHGTQTSASAGGFKQDGTSRDRPFASCSEMGAAFCVSSLK